MLAQEDVLKTDLLAVLAHPDDETMMAMTLARYALVEHRRVAAIYVTRGQGGGNMAGTQAGESLGILRDAELRECLNRLGIRHHWTLGRPDFGYTENAGISLERWSHESVLSDLVRYIRALRPEVILTINPAPVPGQHGHHQAAGWLAVEAYDAASDPARFPEHLSKEGLRTWRPRKLYFGDRNGSTVVDLRATLPDGRSLVDVAGAALSHHRSQAFGNMAGSPWLRRMTNQTLTLVQSVVPFVSGETDLLRGLPVIGDTPPRVYPDRGSEAQWESGLKRATLRFLQRPALERFRELVQGHRIDHAAARVVSDVPVVEGRPWEVALEMANPSPNGFSTSVKFHGPPGWVVEPSSTVVRFSPRRTNVFTVDVTAPPGTAGRDFGITAMAEMPGGDVAISTQLHVVPRHRIPRIAAPATWSADPAAAIWTNLPALSIPSTHLWQGSNSGEDDCSALVRLGHDGRYLLAQVDVRDDVVLSNLAPNDIRGHWRTDSVELCIDPDAGAEHTFGSFKLGILPFDATGKVRAARDADAAEGPVENTAPGTRLASWRTAHGYAVRAMIPFEELRLRYPETRTIGLNVLVYDGDKADAAPGENVNKSRIAWSPRPGVQGRPEDWGRVALE